MPSEKKAVQVDVNVSLPPGARVRVTVERLVDGSTEATTGVTPQEQGVIYSAVYAANGQQKVVGSESSGVVSSTAEISKVSASSIDSRVHPTVVKFTRPFRLETTLFFTALIIYLAVRLIGLANFPIYFFTDEAVQTVMAEDFVQSGLKNYYGELLPTYFNKDPTYNLSSVSVYVQVIPYLLFGKSVYVTRAVSVLIGTLGALAIGLILRDIFKLRFWWCGVLLLSIAPAWFLHSRTAFETVEMTAFYAGFLYFYLRYRYISPRALYGALVMGALVFYTYSPGQLIIVLTGIFLLISDLRYHWQNRKFVLRGLLLLVILVAPYARYIWVHPLALTQQLSVRAPYWSQNIPLLEKLRHYFFDYLYGLNPAYWFIPNQHDLDRHLMKGYGHLLWITFPLFIIGLVIILTKLRSSAHRTTLFAMLVAPSGSALVGIGITRILVFIIPAVLMMSLGLEWLVDWVESRVKSTFKPKAFPEPGKWFSVTVSLILIVIFGIANFAMLRDALVNGRTWYQDYTLAGMQYGASQLFGAVNDYINQHPKAELLVSPNWTNGADSVAEFFLPPGAPVRLGSVDGHIFQHLALDDNLVFVMLQTEMDKVFTSGKFKNVHVDKIIPYPNGQPGFYFAHLQYVDNIDEILAAEQKERSLLQKATLTIQSEPVQVSYSMLDMGSIDLVFDGDLNTVARTLEANPFIIELNFPKVHSYSGYTIVLGSTTAQVTVLLYPEDGGPPVESIANFDGSVSDPGLDVNFQMTVNTQKVRFEIYQPYTGVPANVHVWEIKLK
jgi:4-amino-4-deoxy-L-arabinose transferase-like glycosyltransferase